MNIYREMNNTRIHLLNGGGEVVSTDTLNSGATLLNIGDYDSRSMGIL